MVKRKKAKAETTTSRQRLDSSTTPLSLGAFDLGALLAPVTPEEFHGRIFEIDALHVARPRCPGYYAPLEDLSSPQRLFKLMEDGIVPLYRINMFRCIDGRSKETPPPFSSIEEVKRLFNEGWSIQWLQPQHEHDALSTLVATLESQFGCLVGVNAYLTPGGAQGLAPHWDDVDVFVLQLGGSKAWTLHRHMTSSPLAPEQQTLPRYSSGDLDPELYFPRGIIHHAPNKDSSSLSVHLTISTFQRQTLYDLVQKTFEEAMSELWEEDEMLRRALPWKALTVQAPQKELWPLLWGSSGWSLCDIACPRRCERMRSAWLGCATWFLWMPRPLPCSRSWRMSMKMRPGCCIVRVMRERTT